MLMAIGVRNRVRFGQDVYSEKELQRQAMSGGRFTKAFEEGAILSYDTLCRSEAPGWFRSRLELTVLRFGSPLCDLFTSPFLAGCQGDRCRWCPVAYIRICGPFWAENALFNYFQAICEHFWWEMGWLELIAYEL